jgi:ABC-type glycerol-3-phosphate transport system substrate-binding protein
MGALTACSSSGGSTNESGPVPTAAADCPDGPIVLTVLRAQINPPTDSDLAWYEKQNPCVDFKVTEVPYGELNQKITVLGPSGNAPDIIGLDASLSKTYSSQGLLAPFSLSELPTGWKDDVFSATLKENTYDGKIYSPGLQQSAVALYYNKDMIDAAGIKPPQTLADAWTWPEALAAMQKCQVGPSNNPSVFGLAPSQLGDGTPGFAYRDLLFLRSAGDPKAAKSSTAYKTYYALSPDGKTAEGWLNTPEAVKAATFFQGLFSGPNQVTSKTGIPNALIDGKACFDIHVVKYGKILTTGGLNWGVTPMPYFTTPIVHTGGVELGVSARSKHVALAKAAVVALSTGAGELEYVTTSGAMPTLKSTFKEVPALAGPPFTMFFDEVNQWGQPRPQTPNYGSYDQVVTGALREIAYGADPKEQLDKAAQTLKPLLDR